MDFSFLARRDIVHPIVVAVKRQSQSSPWRTRFAGLLLGLTMLLQVIGVPLWLPYCHWNVTYYGLPYSVGILTLLVALSHLCVLLLGLLGTMIIFAQPKNRIGWLLLIGAVIATIADLCEMYVIYAYLIVPNGLLPLRELALWITGWMLAPVTALISIALPLLFPNGHLPSRGWKWLAVWTIGLTGLISLILAFDPDLPLVNKTLLTENHLNNPYGIASLPHFLISLGSLLILLLYLTIPVACFSLVARFRAADSTTRQQIKWFAFWLVTLVLLYAVLSLYLLLGDSPGLSRLAGIAMRGASIGLPIILGISIFRYRLYDLNIIINRTLVYATLTLGVIALYLGFVVVIGGWLQMQNNPSLPLVAVGIIAIIVNPLRAYLQGVVNRLMFGERDNPYEVLSRLDQQLATAAAPQAILDGMVETVAVALKLPYVAFQIRQNQSYKTCSSFGNSDDEPIILDSIHLNDHVGRLLVSPRTPGESLSPKEWQLLQNISHQAGAIAYTLHLITDLRDSRQRIVTTREEERRRLRRDLHDGLGPTLASQTFDLDRAIDLIPHDPDAAIALLRDLQTKTQDVVAQIRRVVFALRPPVLDELGLVEAIRNHVLREPYIGGILRVRVESPPEGLPSLSAAIEVAAYRIVMEGLTNVLRHAQAHQCWIRFQFKGSPDPQLRVMIEDDGLGLPDSPQRGIGLTSMRERTEELGGTFTVDSQVKRGTRILAELPIIQEVMP